MNFLAHAVLSFDHSEILVGNMISDFVKGKKQYDFEPSVRCGIALHRAIDIYTDEHPATKAMKSFYKKDYGLYSAVLADVSYDYFLANDENIFPHQDHLKSFTTETYKQLSSFKEILPENFAYAFGYMQQQDWLFHYRSDEGIAKSFAGLQRRATYMNDTDQAMEIFKTNRNEMKLLYQEFFPEIQKYALTKLKDLIDAASISLTTK